MLNRTVINELLRVAEQAATAAGQYIHQASSKAFKINKKTGAESLAAQVVTEVDLKSQQIIHDALSSSIKSYDLGWLGEESADDQSRLSKSHFWCVDPLDGTLSFTKGMEGYAVSIALVTQHGEAVLGVVYDPTNQLLYSVSEDYLSPSLKNLTPTVDDHFHLYFDRSMLCNQNYGDIIDDMTSYAKRSGLSGLSTHIGYGAVLNALSVIKHQQAAYFKLPQQKPGGGSIWDFAAISCIYRQLNKPVLSAQGNVLKLNESNSTFMNEQGVVFASHPSIADFILQRIYNY